MTDTGDTVRVHNLAVGQVAEWLVWIARGGGVRR